MDDVIVLVTVFVTAMCLVPHYTLYTDRIRLSPFCEPSITVTTLYSRGKQTLGRQEVGLGFGVTPVLADTPWVLRAHAIYKDDAGTLRGCWGDDKRCFLKPPDTRRSFIENRIYFHI